jgi:hypothetical protein
VIKLVSLQAGLKYFSIVIVCFLGTAPMSQTWSQAIGNVISERENILQQSLSELTRHLLSLHVLFMERAFESY